MKHLAALVFLTFEGHRPKFSDANYGAFLAGGRFDQKWSGISVLEAFGKIRTIAISRPHSIIDQTYTDQTAHNLPANHYSAGDSEHTPDGGNRSATVINRGTAP
jgi:hypothetical protein